MLELRKISTYYGQVPCLRDLSLRLEEGRIIALLGNNGAGKSTVLKTILGLIRDQPVRGAIYFKGQNLVGMDTGQIIRLGIAYVPEGREVWPQLTLKENLLLGAWPRRDQREINADLERILLWFPRLRERLRQMAGTLSGGEQQMLAIGRALMNRPRLLLLDEPSLGLAPNLVQDLSHIIGRINEEGVTILLIEQNATRALDLASYAYLLSSGRVVLEGPTGSLRQDPRLKAVLLGSESDS